MGTPRTETLIMREARQAAKDDQLRVIIEISPSGVTRITMEPLAANRADSQSSNPWDKAVGIAS